MMARIPVPKMTLGSDIKRQGRARDINWSETFHPVVDIKGQDLTLTSGQWKMAFCFICRSLTNNYLSIIILQCFLCSYKA